MKLRLHIISDSGNTSSFEVNRSVLRVGYDPLCEIMIARELAMDIAAQHVRIEVGHDGVHVIDLGSQTGTYLNGARITDRFLFELGKEIRLGHDGPRLRLEVVRENAESIPVVNNAIAALLARLPPPPPLSATGHAPKPQPPALGASSHSTARSVRAEAPSLPRSQAGWSRRHWLITGGAVAAGAIVTASLFWLFGRKSKEPAPAALTSDEIYRKTVASCAWILTPKGTGSACLIDKDRKLVLTAYHVIDGASTIKVCFPKYKDGKLISSRDAYGGADWIAASVWKSDSSKDLAILRAESIPSHVHELPLAPTSPEPGEEVHTVGGSPDGSLGLWIYSKGNVREVQKTEFLLNRRQRINSWVIQTSNPTNLGDSGGPLVNKRCELVGTCCAMDLLADQIRKFIDVREIRELLARKQ